MKLRMIKSNEEIEIIKHGARIADIGGEEIVKNIKEGASELEIAISGRDRMERDCKYLSSCRIYGYLGVVSIWN